MTTAHTDDSWRHDRLIRERVHDTYKLREKLSEPTRCPQCGAVYMKGRWQWVQDVPEHADETICSACHRINDHYPAGEVTIAGRFVAAHKDDIVNLVRNLETAEKNEHPMNRIIAIRDSREELLVMTTDVHLPQRIGKALHRAWGGHLDIHYDEGGYFTSINWQRDD